MSAIRLESFLHPVRPNTSARLISDDELVAIKKEAHEAGIRDGAAAATEAFSSEETRCLSRIQEVIADAFFIREDANRIALSSLRPLIESLVETLGLSLSHQGLVEQISTTVCEYVKNAPEDQLEITVPAGLSGTILDMLDMQNQNITVSEDPTLEDRQARVSWKGGFDLIDLDASSGAVNSAISNFFTELEQSTTSEVNYAI